MYGSNKSTCRACKGFVFVHQICKFCGVLAAVASLIFKLPDIQAQMKVKSDHRGKFAMITLHFHLQPQYNMNFICISHSSIASKLSGLV